MRISDWSSDVCSSDLVGFGDGQLVAFVFAHEREVFGQHGEPRAAAGRLAQQLRGGFEVGDHIIATAHLDRSHRRVHFLRASVLSAARSEEHTSELQSLMRNSYAVFFLKKKNK